MAVRVIEGTRAQWLARRDQLISGKEHRHAQTGINLDLCDTYGRKQPKVRRAKSRSRCDHRTTQSNIFPRPANILARPGGLLEHNPAALNLRFLLHHNSVGARRNRRTGKDPGDRTDLKRYRHATSRHALTHRQRFRT